MKSDKHHSKKLNAIDALKGFAMMSIVIGIAYLYLCIHSHNGIDDYSRAIYEPIAMLSFGTLVFFKRKIFAVSFSAMSAIFGIMLIGSSINMIIDMAQVFLFIIVLICFMPCYFTYYGWNELK